MVLDGAVERGYCTANIGNLLGISAITGGTGPAAGKERGGLVRDRDGQADGDVPQSIWTYFSTSNPQVKSTAVSAGGQFLNW
jgi:hypothetical protein